MKKAIIGILVLFTLNAKSQEKKDTTLQTTLSIDEYRSVIGNIEKFIDSKQVTAYLVELLNKNTKIIADKPKEVPIKPKQ
jgi:cob(I)alamin adenosyltransferase